MRQPELLFVLRGVDHLELIEQAIPTAPLGTKSNAPTLAADDLGAIFDIEIGDAPATKPAAKQTGPKARAGKKAAATTTKAAASIREKPAAKATGPKARAGKKAAPRRAHEGSRLDPREAGGESGRAESPCREEGRGHEETESEAGFEEGVVGGCPGTSCLALRPGDRHSCLSVTLRIVFHRTDRNVCPPAEDPQTVFLRSAFLIDVGGRVPRVHTRTRGARSRSISGSS